MSFIRPSSLVALTLAAVVATSSAARAEITVTPFLGPYLATTRMVFDISSPAIIQQSPMMSVGGALTWRHSPRLALEGSLGYGRGKLDIIANDFASVDAAVVNTEALVRWTLNPNATDTRWELVGGAGAYRLRGALADAYRMQLPGAVRARLSVVGGLTTSWRVNDSARLRLDVLDHMHGSGLELSQLTAGFASSKAVQHDVSMTVGMEMPVWR